MERRGESENERRGEKMRKGENLNVRTLILKIRVIRFNPCNLFLKNKGPVKSPY